MAVGPLLSVVVLNYNGARYNERCLRSLLRQDTAFEIVFADNASTDGSFEQAQALFAHESIVWIQNGANLGYAGGNNAAARHARGEFILFLNNDTEVADCAIERLKHHLAQTPRLAAAQCALVRDSARNELEAAGVNVDIFGFCYAITPGASPESISRPNRIFTAVGAALVVAADWFRRVDGFDSSYFLLFEETDLCWRINLLGGEIKYLPDVRVFHVGSGTRVKGPQQLQLFVRNRVRTIRKNVGFPLVCASLAGNGAGMFALAVVYLLRGKRAQAVAVIRGFCEGLFDGEAAAKRRVIQRERVVSDGQLMRSGLLLMPTLAVLKNSEQYQ